MRMPEPILALIEYDFTEKPKEKDGEKEKTEKDLYPVKSLHELRPDQCTPLCRLEGDREWTLYTHMRPKAPGNYDQQELKLALRLSAPAEEYQVDVAPEYEDETGTWEPLRQCSVGEHTYFYMATKFDKKGRPISGGASGNYISAGQQMLRVSCAGETRYIRLKIFPSSMSEEDYQAVLQDIFLIQRQLLMKDTGAVSVGGKWETVARDVEKQAERMYAAVRRLEAAPDQDLVAVHSRLPAHKVKRFAPRTVMDAAMGKRLLRTEIHEESSDIYEHRMIRTYLESLKKLAAQYRQLERNERRRLLDGQDIPPGMEEEAETEYLAKTVQRQQRQAKKEFDAMIARLSKRPCMESSMDKSLCLSVTGRPELIWDNSGKKFEVVMSSLLGAQEDLLQVRGEREWAFCRKKLVLVPKVNNSWDSILLFLYACIQRIQAQQKNADAPFEVRFTGLFLIRPSPSVDIYWIDGMTITSEGKSFQFRDFFAEMTPETLARCYSGLTEGRLAFDKRDEIFYSMAKLERLNFQAGIIQDLDTRRWADLEQRIDRMIRSSPILRNAGAGERLRTSNLFSRHPDYHRAYTLMRKDEKQLTGIDLWGKSIFRVGPTHQLYELWCLLKMLSIFINDYSFTLCRPEGGAQTLAVLIEQYLHSGRLNGKSFVLERKEGPLAGLRIRLDYDTNRKTIDGGVKRPDYFLKISTVDAAVCQNGYVSGEERSFCMDAKYRNYDPEQQTKWAWYEDLLEVAWDKYVIHLKDVTGSYILHSDVRSQRPALRRYFWSKSDRPKNAREYLERHWERAKVQEAMDQLELLSDCQIGAVSFTPYSSGVDDSDFRGLIQMIMEHYFGLYHFKCWDCGSEGREGLEVRMLKTASGYDKYHITCRKCKRFWVETHCWSCGSRKLGKHLRNYYRSKSDDPWDVICPECGQSAGSRF